MGSLFIAIVLCLSGPSTTTGSALPLRFGAFVGQSNHAVVRAWVSEVRPVTNLIGYLRVEQRLALGLTITQVLGVADLRADAVRCGGIQWALLEPQTPSGALGQPDTQSRGQVAAGRSYWFVLRGADQSLPFALDWQPIDDDPAALLPPRHFAGYRAEADHTMLRVRLQSVGESRVPGASPASVADVLVIEPLAVIWPGLPDAWPRQRPHEGSVVRVIHEPTYREPASGAHLSAGHEYWFVVRRDSGGELFLVDHAPAGARLDVDEGVMAAITALRRDHRGLADDPLPASLRESMVAGRVVVRGWLFRRAADGDSGAGATGNDRVGLVVAEVLQVDPIAFNGPIDCGAWTEIEATDLALAAATPEGRYCDVAVQRGGGTQAGLVVVRAEASVPQLAAGDPPPARLHRYAALEGHELVRVEIVNVDRSWQRAGLIGMKQIPRLDLRIDAVEWQVRGRLAYDRLTRSGERITVYADGTADGRVPEDEHLIAGARYWLVIQRAVGGSLHRIVDWAEVRRGP